MITHRREIDGLRSIAVLPVVAYHANPQWVPGGFVGVDIFFVISGFLITSIIHREMLQEEFSVWKFYERRARRILPAFFFMLVLVLAAGSVLLLPAAFEDLAKSALSALAFSSNVYFWTDIGYFSTAAEYWPLIHTWSLAVEEQFYFIFPLLLFFLMRLRQPTVLWFVLFGVGAASFLASLVGTQHFSSATFYLLPTRLWELMAGAILAIGPIRTPGNQIVAGCAAAVGSVLIITSLFFYSDEVRFPGWWAMLPVLGSGLIIWSGSKTWLAGVLSATPLVFVGLISYSLYLWHWPVLSFARYVNGSVDLPVSWSLTCVLISVLFAAVSWRFVEQPFRRKNQVSRAKVLFGAVATSLVLAAASVLVLINHGWPARWSESDLQIATSVRDFETHKDCWGKVPAEGLCRVGAQGSEPTILVWGDSHAGAMIPAFDFAFNELGLTGVVATHGGCAPLIGVQEQSENGNSCGEFNRAIAKWLNSGDHKLVEVVLVARWNLNATARVPGEPGGDLLLVKTADGTMASSKKTFKYGLGETLRLISNSQMKLTIIGDIPEVGWNVPFSAPIRNRLQLEAPRQITIDEATERSLAATEVFRKLTRSYGFETISLAKHLCKPTCVTVYEGHSVYADDDHVSLWGARNLLGPVLVDEMRANAGGRSADDQITVE